MVLEQAEVIAADASRGDTPQAHITWALKSLASRRAKYERYRAYYEGEQRVTFIAETLRKAFGNKIDQQDAVDNFCGSVVDAVADRLQITGFTVNGESDDQSPIRERTQAIWKRNHMNRRSGEVHTEALTTGDGYLIVWPADGPEDSPREAVLWPQLATEVTVKYDDESPERITRAAKVWFDEDAKRWRCTLYYPDAILRYATPETSAGATTWPTDGTRFQPWAPDGIATEVGNEYGVVPVFHFGNNARTNSFGRSELADVIPLQNSLNKTNARMEVAEEFFAAPQRWAIGWEPETDELTGKPKPTRMHPLEMLWTAGGDGENRPAFGEFAASSPEGLLKSAGEKKADIARVSKTPMHILMLSSDQAPSGEALKTAETPFVKKINDRHRDYGSDWGDVMELALRIEGVKLPDGTDLETTWEDPAPRSEVDSWSTAVLQKQAGVSVEQLLRERGYSDADIERMAEERAAAIETAQRAFDAGAGFAGVRGGAEGEDDEA